MRVGFEDVGEEVGVGEFGVGEEVVLEAKRGGSQKQCISSCFISVIGDFERGGGV